MQIQPQPLPLPVLEDTLRECAKIFPDIHGVIILGSFVRRRRIFDLCNLDLDSHFQSKAKEWKNSKDVYDSLKPNSYMHKEKDSPNDIDIWILVTGKDEEALFEEVRKAQEYFFQDCLDSRDTIDAEKMIQKMIDYFSIYYKKEDFYEGFLRNEIYPWEGGDYARSVQHHLDLENRYTFPDLEVRAFPAPVFNIRPHKIESEAFNTAMKIRREPMILHLVDWLGCDSEYRVPYKTEKANIWPFS